MSSRIANWIIGLGAVMSFAGLCILPGAFGKNPDMSLVPVAASLFSLGAVAIAAGIYIKARALQSAPVVPVVQSPNLTRRQRSGCDLCAQEAPAVFCKIHQLHLCGTCLAQHYDLRSCIYIPTPRKPVTKTVKTANAKARGA
jgi:hypothetical protein